MEAMGGGGRDGGAEGVDPGHLGRLGAPWGPSEAPRKQFPDSLGPSWGSVGGLFGGLGAVVGSSSAVFDHWKLEQARKRSTSGNINANQ